VILDVFVAQRRSEDALAQEFLHGMVYQEGVALVSADGVIEGEVRRVNDRRGWERIRERVGSGRPLGDLSPRPPGIYRFRLAPSKGGKKQAGRRRPA